MLCFVLWDVVMTALKLSLYIESQQSSIFKRKPPPTRLSESSSMFGTMAKAQSTGQGQKPKPKAAVVATPQYPSQETDGSCSKPVGVS